MCEVGLAQSLVLATTTAWAVIPLSSVTHLTMLATTRSPAKFKAWFSTVGAN